MELRSQEVRTLAPENDPLKMGMGWKVEDLAKPQIMVESTFGDSHPGSAHLDQFVKEAVQAVNDNGGKAARYFATDMCDGIAQGHDGINYSLPHRDAIVNLVEAQANASVYDGGVFIASCDKSVPAMLMSIGRLKDMSAIVVTGGVMEAHTLPKEYVVNDPACAINELLTLEQIGKFDAWEKTGVIPNSQLDYYKHNACPSCGACSFMGTASTMQIMAEALGLMLPGTALMPATAPELKQAAYDAGKQLMELVKKGITAKDIVTKKSFENAIMVHAAISGSTNATMHLPAIAHEFGIEIDADTFDRMHRGAHYLLNIRPSGDWPAQYFYYAGGVPRVMEEIKSMLHLDVMTVTGKTLGETGADLDRMFLISSAITKAFHGDGETYARHLRQGERAEPEGMIVHLNPTEQRTIIEALVEQQERQEQAMSQTEQLLRRMTGSITAYMDEVGRYPLHISDYDKTVLAIRDGEFDAFKNLYPRVSDQTDDLLIEVAGRPGVVGGNMTLILLAAVERFSPEAYLTACKRAVETGDSWRVQTLVKESEGRLSEPLPSLHGEVILYAYTNNCRNIAKDLIAQCTPEQIASVPPKLLRWVAEKLDFQTAVDLVDKGVRPGDEVAGILRTLTGQHQEWMAERLLEHGMPVEPDNYDALYACVSNQAVGAAKLLLDRGIDLEQYQLWAEHRPKGDGYTETMEELAAYWSELQNSTQPEDSPMKGMNL